MKTKKLNALKMRDWESFAKIKQSDIILAVALVAITFINFTLFFRGF